MAYELSVNLEYGFTEAGEKIEDRIAAAAGQNRERRRTATHPPKAIPELLADGPSQVWTWDITKLRGPTKGVWFHLYVLIDIYSRYNPSWIVSTHESAELAAEFIAEAIERNGIAPHTVHADRGTSMTSGLVSELLTNLGIIRSHSRPRVSNDNPFSEAQFKTLKYLHDFPKSFASLEDAQVFLEGFFNEYNHIHRHSGIAWHTPTSVHFGTADAVDEARQTRHGFRADRCRFRQAISSNPGRPEKGQGTLTEDPEPSYRFRQGPDKRPQDRHIEDPIWRNTASYFKGLHSSCSSDHCRGKVRRSR